MTYYALSLSLSLSLSYVCVCLYVFLTGNRSILSRCMGELFHKWRHLFAYLSRVYVHSTVCVSVCERCGVIVCVCVCVFVCVCELCVYACVFVCVRDVV